MISSADMHTCSSCLQSLMSSKYSRTQLNKLQYKKIENMRCISCTDALDNANNTSISNKVKDNTDMQLNTNASKDTKQDNKLPKKSKYIDPSMQYINNPLDIPILSEAKSFAELYGLSYQVTLGETIGWRTVVKMAVRGDVRVNKHGKEYLVTTIGLFKPRTHQVISCIESTAHHQKINQALSVIEKVRSKLGIEGYIEGTGIENIQVNDNYKSYLKYLQIVLARQTNQVQLTIVWNTSPDDKEGEKILHAFTKELIAYSKSNHQNTQHYLNLFHSIWVNYNPSSRYNNAITSRESESWKLFYGEEVIEEIIATDMKDPPKLRFPPNVFRQANIYAFTNIIIKIRTWIQSSFTTTTIQKKQVSHNKDKINKIQQIDIQCIELYGGVGTIGLNCLDLFTSLSCSDENPNNKICFDTTLSRMNEIYSKRAYYTSLSATDIIKQYSLRHFNLVIVDPPRKGLDQEAIDALLQYHPEDKVINTMLIYVSCGFQAFKRDATKLTAKDFSNDIFQSTSKNIPISSTSKKRLRNHDSENIQSSGLIRYWQLVHIEGFVLFPGSDHIETLAIFKRIL